MGQCYDTRMGDEGKKPELSVVVPVFSADEYLADMFDALFLDGLRGNAEGFDLELVVVDDASPLEERTRASVRAASAWARVKHLRNETNRGFIFSCNRGLKAAGADEIVLCNSDTRLVPGALRRLVDAARGREDVGMLGPVTNGAFGAKAQLAAGLEGLRDFSRRELDRVDAFGTALAREPRLEDVRWLLRFCVLIKRRVLETVGEMDERFGFGYQEEVDYGIRARRAGWRLCVEPGTFVFHGGVRSSLLAGDGSQTSRARPLRVLWEILVNSARLWRCYGRAELTLPQGLEERRR